MLQLAAAYGSDSDRPAGATERAPRKRKRRRSSSLAARDSDDTQWDELCGVVYCGVVLCPASSGLALERAAAELQEREWAFLEGPLSQRDRALHMTLKYWGHKAKRVRRSEGPALYTEGEPASLVGTRLVVVPALRFAVLEVDSHLQVAESSHPHVTLCCEGSRAEPGDAAMLLQNLSPEGDTTAFYGKELACTSVPLHPPLALTGTVTFFRESAP
eukprot:Rhum_TRINITY_DN8047_c0_g1::Rhum_TRINITY_DN8047_c0_g1_i1::g.25680::m.25680